LRKTHFYLIHFQYLGFRFHGWAKQPQVKTVHRMIDKTLRFVFGHDHFKTMGTSRTDAMVSANHSAFELFIKEPIEDFEAFMLSFNRNSPADIRGLRIEEVDEKFNILNSPKTKSYEYLFAFGSKPHPFAASLVSYISKELNIEVMQKAAKQFEGIHDFGTYCTRPTENTQFVREVLTSEIIENKKYQANFFPEKTFMYRIEAKGFMRNQVRLMVGQLILLGAGEIDQELFDKMLEGRMPEPLTFIAPASGLILEKVNFG
jgi:tRNA pseudouridine38-40 synthase